MLITISNLFPRPDQPTRGMFNAQLFREMGGVKRHQTTDYIAKSEEQGAPRGRGGREERGGNPEFSLLCQGYGGQGIQNPEWGAGTGKSGGDNRQQTTDFRPQTADGRQQGVEGRRQESGDRSQGAEVRSQETGGRSQEGALGSHQPSTINHFLNICLVPEWRIWRWPAIRRWAAPGGEGADIRPQTIDHRPRTSQKSEVVGQESECGRGAMRRDKLPTHYLPVFYLPVIGRSLSWWFYYRSLRRVVLQSLPATIHHSQPQTDPPLAEPFTIHHPITFLASWLYPDAVAVARLAKDMGVPIWLRVHGSDRFNLNNPYRRRLILEAVDYAEGVICNANTVAEYMVKRGVPAGKIHIIPNGADTSLFRYRSKEEGGGGHQTSDIRHQTSDIGRQTGLSLRNEETLVAESVGIPMVQTGRQGGIRKNAATGAGDYHARFDVAESVGIPTVQVERQGGIRKNAATGGAPCILFIANLVPVKGPDILLRAFAALGETTDHRPQTTDYGEPGKGTKSRTTVCEAGSLVGRFAEEERNGETVSRGKMGKGGKGGDRAHSLVHLSSLFKKGFANFTNTVIRGREIRKTLSSPCLCASVVDASSLRPLRSSVQTLPRLLVIGSGPMRGKMEAMAVKLGISDRVHFLGNRPHKEVALWMNRADVLCLTSRSEGMPNVVAEALVSGLPVVATNVGACPEMLAGEPAARVCRSEDVRGIAEALKAVLGMAVDRPALAARHSARYSWRRQAEAMLRLMGEGLMRQNSTYSLSASGDPNNQQQTTPPIT